MLLANTIIGDDIVDLSEAIWTMGSISGSLKFGETNIGPLSDIPGATVTEVSAPDVKPLILTLKVNKWKVTGVKLVNLGIIELIERGLKNAEPKITTPPVLTVDGVNQLARDEFLKLIGTNITHVDPTLRDILVKEVENHGNHRIRARGVSETAKTTHDVTVPKKEAKFN